jgi:exosortase
VATGQVLEAQTHACATHPGDPGLTGSRHILFAVVFCASLTVFWTPLRNLVSLSLKNEEYSHTILVPLMSFALVYLERKTIFSRIRRSGGVGALLLLAGIALDCVGTGHSGVQRPDSYLCLRILSLVILWMAGFIFCYGTSAFRAGAFPLLLTLLMIPLPGPLMEKAVALVQHASAEVLDLFLNLSGAPFFRNGMEFRLAGVDLEVARQCSGIHSTLALLLSSLVIGHLCLRSGWKKIILTLSVFPIVSFTNGLRILAVLLLAAYENMSFLTGNLHRHGGILFFLLGLMILASLVRVLQARLLSTRQGPEERGLACKP